jgi:hypothetical protein
MNSKMMRDTAVSHSIDWLYITDGRNVLVANETEMIRTKREIISDAMTPFEHKIYT